VKLDGHLKDREANIDRETADEMAERAKRGRAQVEPAPVREDPAEENPDAPSPAADPAPEA